MQKNLEPTCRPHWAAPGRALGQSQGPDQWRTPARPTVLWGGLPLAWEPAHWRKGQAGRPGTCHFQKEGRQAGQVHCFNPEPRYTVGGSEAMPHRSARGAHSRDRMQPASGEESAAHTYDPDESQQG